jgi:hypothetical protein
MGYSFISSLAIRDEEGSGRLETLRVTGLKIKREFFAVFSNKRKLSEQAEFFMESLKRESHLS